MWLRHTIALSLGMESLAAMASRMGSVSEIRSATWSMAMMRDGSLGSVARARAVA